MLDGVDDDGNGETDDNDIIKRQFSRLNWTQFWENCSVMKTICEEIPQAAYKVVFYVWVNFCDVPWSMMNGSSHKILNTLCYVLCAVHFTI